MVDQALLKQAEKNHNGAASTPWVSDRPRRTFYDPYGVAMVLPADSVSFQGYIEKGFTLRPPKQPEEMPATQTMADGSTFDLNSITNDDWVNRKAQQQATPVAATPTLTYFTKEGTPLHGLPADPASMAGYLAAGLSLNPPEGADMASETAYYYKDGIREGPFPSEGDWPARYAQKGYSLTPPQDPGAAEEDEPDGLEAKTVADLKLLASTAGIDLGSLRNKAKIIATIRAAREEQAPPADDDYDDMDLDELLALCEEKGVDIEDINAADEDEVADALRKWRAGASS